MNSTANRYVASDALVGRPNERSLLPAIAAGGAAVQRLPALEGQTNVQALETAFNKYGQRLQDDFRDFRTVCTQLILQEQEEKEKWHMLCRKMMQERDQARRRVHALIQEREVRVNPDDAEPVSVPSHPQLPPIRPATSTSSKRSRDDEDAYFRYSPERSPASTSQKHSLPPVPSPSYTSTHFYSVSPPPMSSTLPPLSSLTPSLSSPRCSFGESLRDLSNAPSHRRAHSRSGSLSQPMNVDIPEPAGIIPPHKRRRSTFSMDSNMTLIDGETRSPTLSDSKAQYQLRPISATTIPTR